jgi:hypothetical protein
MVTSKKSDHSPSKRSRVSQAPCRISVMFEGTCSCPARRNSPGGRPGYSTPEPLFGGISEIRPKVPLLIAVIEPSLAAERPAI